MRSLLSTCLNALGVRQFKMVDHGGSAIDFLKLQKLDPMKAGMSSVDLIISNWQMSPVDGMILLRWVRRHADSPNRFIPFIMLSGYSGTGSVAEARNMGATEFVTKPFAIKTFAQRLQLVIERPRQFVHAGDYFGPDRRRRVEAHSGSERRVLTDKSPGVEVIHG